MNFKNLKGLTEVRNFALLAAVVLVIAGAGVFGISVLQVSYKLGKAEEQLRKGWPALAAETIDGHRTAAIRHQTGCRIMISAYYQARRADRLEWVSQACLESGRETPEAYMGLAGARELIGRDSDALQILGQAAPKFDKIPDIYYTAAQIQRRLRRDQDALMNFGRAIERAPQNNQLALEVLEYAVSLEQWELAKGLAGKLKPVETDNPAVKLFLARILAKGGDMPSSQALVAEAKPLMEKKPAELKAALEKDFADVLAGKVTPASADRNLANEANANEAKK
jgi:tetratricopeptide (TPR) repeat protein